MWIKDIVPTMISSHCVKANFPFHVFVPDELLLTLSEIIEVVKYFDKSSIVNKFQMQGKKTLSLLQRPP